MVLNTITNLKIFYFDIRILLAEKYMRKEIIEIENISK
jgi:hypothetical protein